jgi:hypothetical protein
VIDSSLFGRQPDARPVWNDSMPCRQADGLK